MRNSTLFKNNAARASSRFHKPLGRPLGRTLAVVACAAGMLFTTGASAQDRTGRNPADSTGQVRSEQSDRTTGLARPRLSAQEFESVLPLFLNSPEARHLADRVAFRVRQGDLGAAKKLLDTFLEASTFAVLASDWLEEPTLLTVLRAHGIEGTDPSTRGDAAAELDQLRKTQANAAAELRELRKAQADAVAELSELKKALHTAREHAEALAREKAAVAEKLASVQAAQERTSLERQSAAAELDDLKKALHTAREHAEALAREKAAVAEKLASVQAAQERMSLERQSAAAELDDLKKAERERGQAPGENAARTLPPALPMAPAPAVKRPKSKAASATPPEDRPSADAPPAAGSDRMKPGGAGATKSEPARAGRGLERDADVNDRSARPGADMASAPRANDDPPETRSRSRRSGPVEAKATRPSPDPEVAAPVTTLQTGAGTTTHQGSLPRALLPGWLGSGR